MDSDGNSLVSASKKWLALAELACHWQLKRGNSRKFHGARGILMYLNLTFMNLYCKTGILIRWVNYLPRINSARYTADNTDGKVTIDRRLYADVHRFWKSPSFRPARKHVVLPNTSWQAFHKNQPVVNKLWISYYKCLAEIFLIIYL